MHSGDTASNQSLMAEATLPAPGVGELTALLPSWRLHLYCRMCRASRAPGLPGYGVYQYQVPRRYQPGPPRS